MHQDNNNPRRFYRGGESEEEAEVEFYDGLVKAGFVCPCGSGDESVEVPKHVRDPQALLDRMDQEAKEDKQAASLARAKAVASVASPSPSLFDELGDSNLYDGDTPCKFPPPLGTRLPSLLGVVAQAFQDVRGVWSTDRVIADPELGDLFLRRCWELGAQATAFELNWTLLHGRKTSGFPELARARRFVIPRSELDQFAFASEMAARFLQEKHWKNDGRRLSLDKILCDPQLAGEFDALASRIAPSHSILQYRWAALSLRKGRRQLASTVRLRREDFDEVGETSDIRLADIPKARGLYYFASAGEVLFCGHTESLRRQIEIHFDCVGTRIIPDWVDYRQHSAIRLLVAPTSGVSASQRELLKASQVATYRPPLNWIGDSPTRAA